ncbi:MAG: carboxypeptidase-like regulatory domain-containing protein [Saprospiraceae bacterium]|nr:carboxypeptidase-like regulatory domain-containing protein [Saprospiraceae bacterium]
MTRPLDFTCTSCTPAEALVALSRQTTVNIVFSNRFFENCPPVDISVRQQTLQAILEQIGACAKVSFRLVDNQIVFTRRTERFTLSGFARDAETGERLIGVSIYLNGTARNAISTNEYGFFSVPLEPGAYTLVGRYIGYQPLVLPLDLSKDMLLTLSLVPDAALPEVIIKAPSIRKQGTRDRESQHNLPLADMFKLPMPGGEADLLRLAALQPGVQSGVDGLGGLHVRGGNADQNLILLDDVPVYNPNHALGLLSVFNPATVNNARLWKGDFPARYSGRASSVLDIRTRDGHFREYHGDVSVGLFATSVTLEGPLVRDTSSLLISTRATYFGPWIDFFSRRDNLLTISGDNVGYRFYDVNVKWNYIFSPKNRLYFSFYRGGDVFQNQFEQRFDDPEGLFTDTYGLASEWGNSIAALRWNHLLRKNLFTNTTIRFSRFFYQSQLTLLSTFLSSSGKESLLANYGQFYQTLIQDWSAKTDFSYFPSERLTLRWGISYTLHTFQPGALSVNFLVPGQSPITVDSLSKALLNNERLLADEADAYIDAEWRFAKKWSLAAGLNTTVFQIRNSNYGALQPRIRLQRNTESGWSQWLGFHRTAQNLHQIGSFNISLPFELWVPSTAKVPSEKAWQSAMGLGWTGQGWRLQVEGYYKKLDRVLTFLSSNSAIFAGGAEDASGWEDRVAAGEGQGYGLEVTLEKSFSSTLFTTNYTWSKAERRFPDLNSGRPFPFRFDRRHDLKITVQQRLAPWLDASAIWAFATGNPITLAGVKFQHHSPNGDIERTVYAYTEVNGFRLPNYHRLDISMQAHFGNDQVRHAIQLGVYNAYNRANPFFLYVDSGSGTNAKAIQYTLLPLLPVFRYEIKF